MEKNKKIRLDKFLSNMGVGSRTEVKKLIKNGLVSVNGQVVKDAGQLIFSQDQVRCSGEQIAYQEFIYLMMNKPQGVISATEDNYQNTVLDLLEERYQKAGLFPAGRLDKDTEGLLLLTNDGKLAHNMLSPKKHVEKTYFAHIQGVLTQEDIEAFQGGITLEDGYNCMPANLEIIESAPISKANIQIKEGKFHQVKRMFEALDKQVLYLKRVAMGRLILDSTLSLGEYRELNEKEMEIIQEYQ